MCGTKPVPYLGGKLRLPRGTTCQAELQTKFAFYLIDSFVFGRYAEPRTGDFERERLALPSAGKSKCAERSQFRIAIENFVDREGPLVKRNCKPNFPSI